MTSTKDSVPTLSFSTLLCPIDFSAQSRRALQHAGAWAEHFAARLVVLHVNDPLLANAAAISFDAAYLSRETRKEVEKFVHDSLGEPAASSMPDLRTSVGDPASEILRVANETGADGIVIGTRGSSGYKKLFFGSVTETVLAQTQIPVLAVSDDLESGTETAFRAGSGPILAPIDFTEGSVRECSLALALAASFKVPLILLHVTPRLLVAPRWQTEAERHNKARVSEAHERLLALAEPLRSKGGVDVQVMVRAGRPAEEIAQTAIETHASILLMGLRMKDAFIAHAPGSIAYRVLSLAQVPVLTIPGHTIGMKDPNGPAVRNS